MASLTKVNLTKVNRAKESISKKSKLAQEKLQTKIAQSRQSKIVKTIEEKLPFAVSEESLREIANNIIERAREIRQGLKKDPIATVKNYKSLLDFNSLTLVKKKSEVKKSKKSMTPKKALKKAKTTKAKKKAIH